MTKYANKEERLQVRLDRDAKQVLEKAARYENQTLSGFVLTKALDEARQVIDRHEILRINEQDWGQVMAAIDNPPTANEALKRAHKRHRQLIQ